jgi:uncharacterized glyoxalase superfamily protein PhnB
MSKSTQPIPPGHEHLIAHLLCVPCAEAIEFYKKAFGAEETCRIMAPDGKRIMHAELKIGKNVVFVNDAFPEHCGGTVAYSFPLKWTPVTLHQYVTDCDAAIKRAADAGATVRMPAADMFWGDRYGMVIDPFGHEWTFATHMRDMSPEEMKASMAEAFKQKP